MSKLAVILLAMATMAASGATPPKIQFLGATQNSLAVQITAGSSGTPNGFTLFWQAQGTCQAVFLASLCPQYALPPGASTIIVVGQAQCNGCHIDTCFGILCDTTYALWVTADGISSQVTYGTTWSCL